jgi:hypothetical protein
MKLAGAVLAVLLLGGSIRCMGQADTQTASQRAENEVIKYLQTALRPTGKAARIYFHGTCNAGGTNGLRFPEIDVQPPAESETGLDAVRAIFRNDKGVMVTESRSGVIRISIGDVFTQILNARLPSLRLNQPARYNPDGPGGAIDTIEQAAAVKTAMRKLGVSQGPVFYIGLREPAIRTRPHLPRSMKNVTVDQALDSVAKTFPGVVVYSECTQPGGGRLIDIKFDWFHTDK